MDGPTKTSTSTSTSTSTTTHNEVTLALAKKESAEHMLGMDELAREMAQRPFKVHAYAYDPANDNANGNGNGNAKANGNTKIVHFVRHGQGFHNLLADIATEAGTTWQQFVPSPDNPYTRPEIRDAPLTQKGREQARALQSRVAQFPHPPELVVMSPNCRALQTGLIAFEQLDPEVVPFVAHEMVREECGAHICDMRRPTSQQRHEFPQVQFHLLPDENDNDQDPLYDPHRRETKAEVGERIYQFLQWLAERPETHVGVTSHSGWLLTLFNGVLQCDDSNDNDDDDDDDDNTNASLKAWFQTGELRSVKLVFSQNKESASECE